MPADRRSTSRSAGAGGCHLPEEVLAVGALLLASTGCGQATEGGVGEPTPAGGPTTSAAASSTASPAASPSGSPPPCDPGGGFPRARKGCPDASPQTGWLRRHRDGRLFLEPFRTYGNDAEGKAYAESKGLEYLFSNDYYDAVTGPAREFQLDPGTVCIGIIEVGYQEPLEDHAVPCADLVTAAARMRVAVAVWRDGGAVVQASELYRP